jgi:hypothetical protein
VVASILSNSNALGTLCCRRSDPNFEHLCTVNFQEENFFFNKRPTMRTCCLLAEHSYQYIKLHDPARDQLWNTSRDDDHDILYNRRVNVKGNRTGLIQIQTFQKANKIHGKNSRQGNLIVCAQYPLLPLLKRLACKLRFFGHCHLIPQYGARQYCQPLYFRKSVTEQRKTECFVFYSGLRWLKLTSCQYIHEVL